MASSLHLICLLLTATLSPSLPTSHAQISRKELRTKIEVNLGNVKQQRGLSVQSNTTDPSRVVQLSWRPRVFLYEGFLTDEECDHLISLAHGKKEELPGDGDESGNLVNKTLLETSEASSNMDDDDIVASIEKRISAWVFLPIENSRQLQVEHYQLEDTEQKYDYFGNKSPSSVVEPLMATVVLYLSDVTQGGEIIFPKSEVLSDCGQSSYVLKPIKRNAVLFFTTNLSASPDVSSPHARCPILAGEMWCATKFFHIRPINQQAQAVPTQSDDSDCTDESENCHQWAATGECHRNPMYMVGTPDYYGACRKSCNAC